MSAGKDARGTHPDDIAFGPSWFDRAIAYFAPGIGVSRARSRHILNALRGYEASESSRKRRFHRNELAGDALARTGAVALRNQARHLERNHDVARGILDKLVDFTIGPCGITVEPQPRHLDGKIHEGFAEELERAYAKWSEWPEVTWTHDRASMERLAGRTWFRDGEVFGQMVSGQRADLEYGSDVPFALELIEPDLLDMNLDDTSRGLRQGIERNAWGRPRAYHLYTSHPGDDRALLSLKTVRVPSERMLHVRLVDRIGQLRGVTIFASIITTLQDLFEYEDAERIAAKMAASLVLKITRGEAAMFDTTKAFDPTQPPVYQMDGGMVVVNQGPGEDSDLFDTKRPNPNTEGFVNGQLRRVASGAGLSYSSVSRNYNGTYSAQRQELVENWPHYHAQTGMFVAQWSRPSYQQFVRWYALTHRVPLDVNPDALTDALYFGPPMPWIDPVKEAEGQLMLVQACFKSSAAVIRERGGSLRDTYRQLTLEGELRKELGLRSSAEAPTAVSPANPATDPAPDPEAPPPDEGYTDGSVVAQLQAQRELRLLDRAVDLLRDAA